MLKIKEYAENNGVSYEAVRKQVNRYQKELENHIIKKGRTKYLDDFAVEFLNTKRSENPVIVVAADKNEELDRLKEENKNLLFKIAELQEQLLKEKEQVKELQTEKILLLEEKAAVPEQKKKWYHFW